MHVWSSSGHLRYLRPLAYLKHLFKTTIWYTPKSYHHYSKYSSCVNISGISLWPSNVILFSHFTKVEGDPLCCKSSAEDTMLPIACAMFGMAYGHWAAGTPALWKACRVNSLRTQDSIYSPNRGVKSSWVAVIWGRICKSQYSLSLIFSWNTSGHCMLSICSWHNSYLTRLQSRSILQVRILETTFFGFLFFCCFWCCCCCLRLTIDTWRKAAPVPNCPKAAANCTWENFSKKLLEIDRKAATQNSLATSNLGKDLLPLFRATFK